MTIFICSLKHRQNIKLLPTSHLVRKFWSPVLSPALELTSQGMFPLSSPPLGSLKVKTEEYRSSDTSNMFNSPFLRHGKSEHSSNNQRTAS